MFEKIYEDLQYSQENVFGRANFQDKCKFVASIPHKDGLLHKLVLRIFQNFRKIIIIEHLLWCITWLKMNIQFLS